MGLDLANPQHVEALRWAASLSVPVRVTYLAERATWVVTWQTSTTGRATPQSRLMAARTLSDPARAAEVVRWLLERVGVEACTPRPAWLNIRMSECTTRTMHFMHPLVLRDVPRLVLRLLDATSAEEAMAAMREVGG